MRRVQDGMFVRCQLGSLSVGIDLDCVQEIIRHVEPTFVPLLPPHLRGLINLRGSLVAVVDLGAVVRGVPMAAADAARTVVVASGGEALGLAVDAVGDVVDVGGRPVEPLPSHLPAEQRRWFRGLVQTEAGLLLLLDLDAVDRACGAAAAEGAR